jgi:hypothetical protein
MITPINQNYNQPKFSANLKSPKLQYSAEDFFIKIKGYGKNEEWVNIIKDTADSAVKMIQKNKGDIK